MMLQRLLKEESGMALALAIMMVVLIGVMGAGLLVFANTDIDSVVESNQGQTALNLADAGVQVAKSHLLETDALYLSYDGITNPGANPPNPADSAWSCGVWDTTTKTCGAAGKSLTLDANNNPVTVWIQYLRPALTDAQANDSTGVYAPEVVLSGDNYPVGQDYFKVISQATVGQTKRKVEAIFNTNANSLGVPRSVYTPGSIELSGNSGHVTNISLFAGTNITGQHTDTFVQGIDYAYKNWAVLPNTTPRSNPGSCTDPLDATQPPGPCAGLGALGTIERKIAGRDYDATTCPKFVLSLTAPSTCPSPSTMTFPFNATTPDIETLRYAAQSQQNGIGGDNYYEVNSSTSVVSAAAGETRPVWPTNNKASTVVFVKFTSTNRVTWGVGSRCTDPPVRGTLVVENGTFDTAPNKTPLRGMVVISGAGPGTRVYNDSGNTCMQAFIAASGDIKIAGNVGAATQERGSVPSSYGLKLVSWRELYQ
jgi:hypothetical protein